VAGSGWVVRYRDAAGTIRHSELTGVRAAVLATGRPWRTFRSRRGQLHYSGWYWSSTVKRLVAYESRLELVRLLLADFDPGVVEIAAQPFRIEGQRDRRPRAHVPDFLLIRRDGSAIVVNVKPADRLSHGRVAESLAWAGELFADRGWHHEVWSAEQPARMANIRFLAGSR
jgi:TnsA-like endonuclease N terminal